MKHVLLIMTLALVSLGASVPAAQAEGLKIGVIRLTDAFEAYQKTKDLDKKLNATLKAEFERSKEMKTELEKLEKDSKNKMLNPQKRMELTEQFQVKKLQYELFRKRTLATAEQNQLQSIQTVYQDMQKTIKAYGKANGFSLILQMQRATGKNSNFKELEKEINLTMIMYHADSIDVTDAVVKQLNAEYKPQ